MVRALTSKLDKSVNFVIPSPQDKGFFEARFVQRKPEYYVCYLSSQTGCNHACRMCHLTQTGQTMHQDASVRDFREQARWVHRHADDEVRGANTVHYNFMARGEPLACSTILEDWETLSNHLVVEARIRKLLPRFLVSTILPADLGKGIDLTEFFPVNQPEIYWSLYTADPEKRKRLLPRAMGADYAAATLKHWQDTTNKIPKVHFAFIEGVNDEAEDIEGIIYLLDKFGLHVNFNIVRYNPVDENGPLEPPEDVIFDRMDQLQGAFPRSRVDLIDRVGFDVKASCGMFVGGDE